MGDGDHRYPRSDIGKDVEQAIEQSQAHDKDKRQVAQSSNPDEISPLDVRSISPLAKGFGQDSPSEALDKLAASAAAGRRAYDEVYRGHGPLEAAASRAISETPPAPSDGQRTEMASSETPIRVEPSSGQPMHPRDKRLFVFLGIWGAIFTGVFLGGVAAFVAGSPHWGASLCAGGLVGAYAMALHLLERRPAVPTARSVWAILIAAAVMTWIFDALQIWTAYHKPMQGYTQAQLDTAVLAAKPSVKASSVVTPQTVSPAQNLGRVSWSNLFNGLTQPTQLRQLSGWWIILTAPPENSEAEKELNTLLMLSSNLSKTLRPAGLPDYARDLDAPKLEGKALRGITIHGRNDAADFIAVTLSNCFNVLRTAEMPANLFDYYHRQSSTIFPEDKFVWLEIGNGSPWKGNCRE
jgi:hypothetical protein